MDTVWALVVAWCPEEPERLGEILSIPPGDPGAARQFGRGVGAPGERPSRVMLSRQRPGRLDMAAPLRLRRISRSQLALRSFTDRLEIASTGRCPMTINGRAQESGALRSGDVVELVGQIMFLCERRPAWIEQLDTVELHPFGSPDTHGLVGETAPIWELRRQLRFLGPRDAHVLIRGESGVGKELAARALHALSEKADGPLVSRNAATLPEGLIDAELFGNLANYPNPGMPERPGLIGAAAGGTLMLDEFAELPEGLQAHLLRVLDAGEYQRLGDVEVLRADFRLLAATNRAESVIKHDVLARMPLRLALPDLNARRADIPLLANHLLRRIAQEDPEIARRFFPDDPKVSAPRISARLVRQLLGRTWRSHVRELESLLWDAMSRSSGDQIEPLSATRVLNQAHSAPQHAPDTAAPPAPAITDFTPYIGAPPDSIPGPVLQACLDANNGVQEKVWRLLGFKSRFVLRRLIKKHTLIIRRSPDAG
ncbi:MAG: sigma 54-interacting transcriptional regulator [Myxococcota bacterium]